MVKWLGQAHTHWWWDMKWVQGRSSPLFDLSGISKRLNWEPLTYFLRGILGMEKWRHRIKLQVYVKNSLESVFFFSLGAFPLSGHYLTAFQWPLLPHMRSLHQINSMPYVEAIRQESWNMKKTQRSTSLIDMMEQTILSSSDQRKQQRRNRKSFEWKGKKGSRF